MKTIFSILLLCFSPFAFSLSFVPERIVTPLLDVFNSKNQEVGADMEVRVTTYNSLGGLRKNGGKLLVEREIFNTFKQQASAVYAMNTREWRGTAFHIGNDLVLTNLHVLSKGMTNTKSCGTFQLVDKGGPNNYQCKKVHFCHKQMDVCLIEMKPVKRGCFFCKKTTHHLSQGQALKIRANWSPSYNERESTILTAIGNSQGLGIHLSQGRGLAKTRRDVYFYAPITGGNSGGALLDEEGVVVGVVKAETIKKVGNDANTVFNVAASSDLVVREIRSALSHDPETLEKFNAAVIE